MSAFSIPQQSSSLPLLLLCLQLVAYPVGRAINSPKGGIGVTIERGACRPGRVLTPGGSVFRATAHDAVHDAAHVAFMTLPPYTCTRAGEAPQLGSSLTLRRVGFGVRKRDVCTRQGSG